MNIGNNDFSTAYPVIIFNLTNKKLSIPKEEYNYDILILDTDNQLKLHHITKIAIILSDLETNTQLEKVSRLISYLKENEIVPIVFSENNIPAIIRNTTLVINNASIDDLKLFLKVLDLLVFKICLVCIDFNDVIEFLKSSTGEMILYKKENIPLKKSLKQIEKDLGQNNFEKSIILMEIGYNQPFQEADEIISDIYNKLNSESFLYQVCLDKNLKENQINLYLVLINEQER